MFKLQKESNYDMLHWALFIACAFTLTFKVVETATNKSMAIFAFQPELAQYSTIVQFFS